MDWATALPGIIVAGVPILLYIVKLLIPKIPKWLIPILAPVLGGLVDAAIAYGSGGTANPIVGAFLGSAGVGLREIIDQLKKAGQ